MVRKTTVTQKQTCYVVKLQIMFDNYTFQYIKKKKKTF